MWGEKKRTEQAVKPKENYWEKEEREKREAQSRVGPGTAKYHGMEFGVVENKRLEARISELLDGAERCGERLFYVVVPRDDGNWNLYFRSEVTDWHMRARVTSTVSIIEGQFAALGEMMKTLKQAVEKKTE